jgi:hypothetical protein
MIAQQTTRRTTAMTATTTTHLYRRRARRLLASCAAALLAVALMAAPALADPSEEFGIQPGSFTAGATDSSGQPDTQAGGHPYEATTEFVFNTQYDQHFEKQLPVEPIKDVITELPAGFTGDPRAAATCTQLQMYTTLALGATACPASSQVGEATVDADQGFFRNKYSVPVFNLEPEDGQVAVFGFNVSGVIVHVVASVRTDADYGITATAINTSQQLSIYSVSVSLWGVPADPSYTERRGRRCTESVFGKFCEAGGEPAGIPPRAFVSNPTNCTSGPPVTTLKVDSWLNPGVVKSYSTTSPATTGCDALKFEPTIAARPTTNVADSPSGLKFDLSIPQDESPNGLATAHLKDAVVTLPPGLTVNPSSANGLAACSPAQIGLTTPVGQADAHFDNNPNACPDGSKLGTVEVHSVLDHPLKGSVYLASQNQNPFGSMLALYLAIEDPRSGLIVKLPGEVKADHTSGQLTATFRENPQLPVEDLKVEFFEGAGGSLRTPATCGQYSTTSSMTPWSAPYSGPPATPSDSWAIERAPRGACASAAASLPNSPSFEAGTVTPLSGAYSPFVMKLTREDGSQELKGLNLTLPPGLTGKLAGIPYCSDAQIAQAQSRNKPEEGAVEKAHPSCPQASEVGTVTIGAGAGPNPYYVQGHAYLAGPYKGAPLSLVIVTPAVAGPFDLGTVVVRAALFVNPETAQITVKSDEIPHILEGIPLDVRSIAVSVDRSGFTLNPTNCEAQSITGSAVAVGGSEASLSNRFQVGECGALPFKPKLKLRLKGATGRIGHPALTAVLTAKPGEAGIGRAQVNLPHGEFLDQGNLNKTCTKPVLLAGQCPASTVYGHATAWTPLLEKPLEGNVYLVGGYGYKLPALVAELNGQIRILLVGKVDSGKNKGIRNTFELVPDAPVEKFVLEMKGGKKYGLLENSENLCTATKANRQANVRFTGQNGKVTQYKPVVANQCGKAKKKNKKHAGHAQKRSQR